MTWTWLEALGEVHQPGADAMALAGEMGQKMNLALGYLLGRTWNIPKTMGHAEKKG